jgi:hypothetical protein
MVRHDSGWWLRTRAAERREELNVIEIVAAALTSDSTQLLRCHLMGVLMMVCGG